MNYLKAIWLFCSYLFVPQRRQHPEDVGFTEIRKHGFTELRKYGFTDRQRYGFTECAEHRIYGVTDLRNYGEPEGR